MKKYWILLAGVLLLAGCTSPKKEQLKYGEIIPTEDGMILPMANAPGEKQDNWCVRLIIADNDVILQSPKQLESCYFTILGKNLDTNEDEVRYVDLDFQGGRNGGYIYSIPYLWFPAKVWMEKTEQLVIYYVPEGLDYPVIEKETENGPISYPDVTGYYFLFEQEEIQRLFAPLTAHLR